MASDLSKYEIYIIKPQATQNLVRNPIPFYKLDGYVSDNSQVLLDDTHTRRGPQCIRVTPNIASIGGLLAYGPLSVESIKSYSFSVDVKGVKGRAYNIGVQKRDGLDNPDVAVEPFISTGNWQRISLSFIAEETSDEYFVFVQCASAATVASFWVDGFQFEQLSKATTFTQGWMGGLGYMGTYPEYGWVGAAGNSASWRSSWTRHGGALIRLKDYANIGSLPGLSMAPFDQITTPIVTGGALYQKHIRKTRPFNIVVQYEGETLGDIQQKRRVVLDLLRPDATPFEQPMVLRYQGFDADGNEASDPIDIICIFESCHTDPPADPKSQTDVLNFTAIDGQLQGAFKNGATLDYRINYDAHFLVKQNAQGKWTTDEGYNLAEGVNSSFVDKIVEAPNGDIYICGRFGSVSNKEIPVANTSRIARWSKRNQRWESLGVPSAPVGEALLDMAFDSRGNLYAVGGTIGSDGTVLKYDFEAGTITKVGGGTIKGLVRQIAISPDGVIYIAGRFASITGSNSNCKSIAWLDTSLNLWQPLANGLNSGGSTADVMALEFHPNGNLIIGGDFTHAAGTNKGMKVCFWRTGAFYAFEDYGATAFGAADIINAVGITPDGTIVIGGDFTNAGGDVNADNIARWNGTNWQAIGGAGTNDEVLQISCTRDGAIYAMGRFTRIGDITLRGKIAVYQRGAWQPLEIMLPEEAVHTVLLASDESLYIGGSFTGTATAPNPGEVEYKATASSGSANTYPLIEIIGPGELTAVTNYTTKRTLQFNNLVLQEDEKIWIRLDPTNLQMTSSWQGRGSVWKYLNAGSDIGDWFIRPGTNYIGVFIPVLPAGADPAATRAYIHWYPKYWSIEGAVHG